MNRRLRELHRGAFCALALAVPTLFAAALWQRGPTGVAARSDATEGATPWPEEGLAVEVRMGHGGVRVLTVREHGRPAPPGRALYWSEREAPPDASLPVGAVALPAASVAGSGAPLPAGGSRGWLLAYDVAQQLVRSALALPVGTEH
ncbi:MAG: hypothetical protein GC161_05285 [Planctomycetaceae bacterium]|nr:hypothetical protein [Planctomycetaceae bacterium]